MRINVGSGEIQFLDKACKCFSRNPAQVNDLNGVESSTSVWHKSHITQFLNVESKSFGMFQIKHLMHSCPRMRPFILNCALLQV